MIGADIAAALPELRAQAESLMVDAVLIERRAGQSTDQVTGKVVDVFEPVWSGKCRWLRPVTWDNPTQVADSEIAKVDRDMRLPVDGTGEVRRGDRVTCTASAHDPARVGEVAWVRVVETQSQPVHRRLLCREVQD